MGASGAGADFWTRCGLRVATAYADTQPQQCGNANAGPVAHGEEPKEKLPIAQVILYSSGVGYFQREGTVEGNARVDLTFDVRDINDLIKSMTLRDLDGGHVSAVSYDSNAPVERTLQSFAVNLNGNPTFGQILNQARGEKVEVVLQQGNTTQPGTMTGTLIGIETQTHQVGKDATVGSACWLSSAPTCLLISLSDW